MENIYVRIQLSLLSINFGLFLIDLTKEVLYIVLILIPLFGLIWDKNSFGGRK